MTDTPELTDTAICLKPVSALLTNDAGQPATYRIAAYQRGYRWSPRQVADLLNDLWDFHQGSGNHSKEAFYCLQPLVIKPEGDSFEVVDGQQRLTTILLILNFFNQRRVEEEREKLYSIIFETRAGFNEFLAAPSEEGARSNVDFFHLYGAMQEIKEWFKTRRTFVNDIESVLLNRTKVIWFRLAEGDHPVDAFTRLNAGKIPLGNDELIRALFLRRSKPGESETEAAQLRIASEWDTIEKALQEPAFWGFLSNQPGTTRNRIGFLFELMAQAEGIPAEVADDPYAIFHVFNRKLKAAADPEQEWLKVKEEFMRLQEWFEDRDLFHIVGYLVNEEVSINELRELAQSGTKSEFDRRLRREIFARVIGGGVSPEELLPEEVRAQVDKKLQNLEYGSARSNEEVKSLLLLFNVATLLQSKKSNMRFQFDSFKGDQKWNIEHVRSIASEPPQSYSERQTWLQLCQGYLVSHGKKKLLAEIEKYLTLPKPETSNEKFDALFSKVLQEFGEAKDSEIVHGIANLALLDEGTNKSYKNAPFAVKRQWLLARDKAGIFVPLCTRNVFLKCYSPQADNVMFWSDQDQDAYYHAIMETLVGFFTGQTEDVQ